MEFSNGSEVKSTQKKDIKLDFKSIGPFYTNKFPTAGVYIPPAFNE